MSLVELELSPECAGKMAEALARRTGLILICGPTGSGKSKTADLLIEAVAPNRTPVQLDPALHIGRSLDESHVIHAGDLRDTPESDFAVQLALKTLVIATMRSGRSWAATVRLSEMGVSRTAIERVAPTIITQQLVGRLCMLCRAPTRVTASELASLRLDERAIELTDGWVYAASGCASCKDGYLGKIPLFEVLPSAEVHESGGDPLRPDGIVRDGMLKMMSGITSISELFRVL